MTDVGLKRLPLEDLHQAAGARFGGFAGWSMPLTYPAGVMKEHLHTREHAGLFDISHMRLIEVSGPGAAALLSHACPLAAEEIVERQSKYTFLLTETAGISDDLIVTRLGPTRFMVVANAGNAEKDAAHLREFAAGLDAKVEPLERVFLAIQGPEAWAALSRAGIETGELTFMTGFEPKPGWFMSRSGYTGEDGFEIGLPEADAREFVAKLLEDDRVMWVGLAARDSLRLEAGLCLHGQDISEETDPVSAGLLWAIPKRLRSEGTFVGAEALHKEIALGAPEKRVGLKPEGRQPVRAGAVLTDEHGQAVGRVTSGGFGPSVGHPVAIGYVSTPLAAAATRVFADVRGSKIALDIHPLPFAPHRYRKG
ncbi:glycine cleavage system aminomethyltransferase GcvT [Pseudaminobacter sp. 19-2017]|uniref:aminomethyltransferase n=1 Tax=Pseudaminobacter soli (ex Zhang et al. 2022) TaxID=2831468 RepID=A0A942IBE7_9HYPH|nr:glycine cleavage system aminomethyltransferase GcvT [Pseudaminobacter soli]MBS3652235.1 glycine cleavage system aminomethyltransferase GcvT [Pseudaminobacter soli]